MRKRLFTLLLLSASCAIAAPQKWVDENGKTHYSDLPPRGVETSSVRTPLAASPSTPSKSPAERDADLKKARQAKQEEADRAAQQQANAEIMQSNCNSARQVLRTYQSGIPMAEYDERGERRYLEDNERQQRSDKAREDIAKWCK